MRLWAKPDEILHHRAGFELSGEMVGEVGDHAAVDFRRSQFAIEVGEGEVEGFLDHQAKVFGGIRLCKFGNASGDDVHRPHND